MKNYVLTILVCIVTITVIILLYFQISADSNTWYFDADGDTLGDYNVSVKSKSQPLGFVLDSSDPNDNDKCVPNSKYCKDSKIRILDILNSYYKIADSRNIERQLQFYDIPLSNYFQHKDQSHLDLEKRFKAYYSSISEHKHKPNIDRSEIHYQKLNANGDSLFRAQFNLVYEFQRTFDTLGLYKKEVQNTVDLRVGLDEMKIVGISGTSGICISIGEICYTASGQKGIINDRCICK